MDDVERLARSMKEPIKKRVKEAISKVTNTRISSATRRGLDAYFKASLASSRVYRNTYLGIFKQSQLVLIFCFCMSLGNREKLLMFLMMSCVSSRNEGYG
jgi:hypothetical protein